jgi:hypothetical protein
MGTRGVCPTGGISLLQNHYVEKVLNRFGYRECSPAATPYDPSMSLRKNQRIARDQLRYSQIIGSLMYLASATRPDISYVVSKLSHLFQTQERIIGKLLKEYYAI